jgi:ribose transport system substrate-binding protein
MAIGAVNALKAANMAGKVPVVGVDAIPEAVQAIKDGNMVATALADAVWQGGVGLAIGYCVLTGKIDVASLSNDKRSWFAKSTIVTPENVDQFTGAPTEQAYASEWNCDNVWNRFLAPLP